MARAPLTRNLCEYSGGSWGISQRVREAFGFKGNKIPADLKGRFVIDGHTIIVFKSGKTPKMPRGKGRSSYNPSSSKRYFHRMFFMEGRRLFPVGRARQALKCSLKSYGSNAKGRYR